MSKNINKSLSLPPELAEKIEEYAVTQRRSFNAQVTVILEEKMAQVLTEGQHDSRG